MTDHDLSVARDIGSLQADMRTVKHDVANISAKIDGLAAQLSKSNVTQARGLGFFAGAAFIITTAGGLLITVTKLLWGAN